MAVSGSVLGAVVYMVDDEPEIGEIFREQLTGEFGEVRVFLDPQRALSEIRSRSDVDVLVTDYQMPGLNGLELMAALREERPYLPVLLLTGNAHEPAVNQALKSGAFDIMEKPWSRQVLINRIRNAVRTRLLLKSAVHLSANLDVKFNWTQLSRLNLAEQIKVLKLQGATWGTLSDDLSQTSAR